MTQPEDPQTRPETGPMKFGSDWRGVFIRGDSAIGYWMALEGFLRSQPKDPNKPLGQTLQLLQIQGLADTLYQACQLQLESAPPMTPDTEVQHMKPFKIAKVSDPMTAYEQLVQTEPTAIVSQEEYDEIAQDEHPENYFICGHQFMDSIIFNRIGREPIRVPNSLFGWSNITPDFDKFQIIDAGQTVKFGDYEADVSAIIHDIESECLIP